MLTMWLQYAYDLLTTCNFGRYLQRNCAAILKKIKILLTICLQFAYICNFCRNIPIFNVDLWLQSCRSLSVTEMKPLHASSLNQCQTKSQRSRRRRKKKTFERTRSHPTPCQCSAWWLLCCKWFLYIFFSSSSFILNSQQPTESPAKSTATYIGHVGRRRGLI